MAHRRPPKLGVDRVKKLEKIQILMFFLEFKIRICGSVAASSLHPHSPRIRYIKRRVLRREVERLLNFVSISPDASGQLPLNQGALHRFTATFLARDERNRALDDAGSSLKTLQ